MKNVLATLVIFMIAFPATAQVNPLGQGATIWFYRPADSYPADIPTLYAVGGITRQLAKIAPGEFFGYSVPPGVYVFSHTRAPARGESIAISINTGQQAYVEVHFREMKSVSSDAGITVFVR
jgi:hypothetical protein